MNCAATAKGVLNLRGGIRCADQFVDGVLWRICTDFYAVTDVACWLAGILECASHINLGAVNLNAALRRLPVTIVTKARSNGSEQ